MTINRLPDYLGHMRQAIADAQAFTEGMAQPDFEQDKRTQQAVVMSLIVLGEAATKVMDQHPEFAAEHAEIPWRSMRGMRNRIAHGYFDIDLAVVWDTLQTALPTLKVQLDSIVPNLAGVALLETEGGATWLKLATNPCRTMRLFAKHCWPSLVCKRRLTIWKRNTPRCTS